MPRHPVAVTAAGCSGYNMEQVAMKKTSPALGRPAERCNLIVRELRMEIVRGELRPRERMPTRAEIEKRFGASTVTVQRALEKLVEEGFVCVQGRQGTYVADRPPHLHRIALAFPTLSRKDRAWVRFWTALESEARKLAESGQRDVTIYEGVSTQATHEGREALLRDVVSHRLAGIIFATTPTPLVGTPFLDEPGIPRVAIMSPGGWNGVPQVATDATSFYERALEFLQRKNKKRVAFVVPVGHERIVQQLMGQMPQYGLQSRDSWLQMVNLGSPYTVENTIKLLMDPGQAVRPDALVISDDNLVEHATRALKELGVGVPGQLEVIAHCNFPYPTPSAVPATRLGYHAARVLQACLESLDGQRQGLDVPHQTIICAQFEDEVTA